MFDTGNSRAEDLSPDSLRSLQFSKLRKQLIRVYDESTYYREKFDSARVNPYDFKSLEQLREYPFFDKEEERLSQAASREKLGHPLGLHVTCDVKDVRRISSSSGTTGTPTFSGFTQRDRDITAANMSRLFVRAGIGAGDTVMHAGVLSMWIAGLPNLDSMMGAGACVIPMGALSGIRRLTQIAVTTRPKVILCTPSYALSLCRKMEALTGVDPKSLGVEKFLVSGEPGGSIEEIYGTISESFGGAEVFDVMGATGCHTPTGVSCEAHSGIHYYAPDNAYFEIVDPDTLEPLPIEDGVVGEIVFTGLDKECGPLIRWRDKDIIRVSTGPCVCGRSGVRMTFCGRVDDMLLVRGVNVFPNAVRDVIASASPLTTGNIRVLKASAGPAQEPPLTVKIEISKHASKGELRTLESLLRTEVYHKLRVMIRPVFVLEHEFSVVTNMTGKVVLVEEPEAESTL